MIPYMHCIPNCMSAVKCLDNKPVVMISTIDNGNPTNTVNVKDSRKAMKERWILQLKLVSRFQTHF